MTCSHRTPGSHRKHIPCGMNGAPEKMFAKKSIISILLKDKGLCRELSKPHRWGSGTRQEGYSALNWNQENRLHTHAHHHGESTGSVLRWSLLATSAFVLIEIAAGIRAH